MNFINAKRLRDYPRLMLITTWAILGFNLIFRNGWLGGLNQIIGSDFITLYSAGLIYRTDITHLYDLPNQQIIQQGLIKPTQLPGVNPFISPPYVAQAYSIFTYSPLSIAFIIWTLLSIILAVEAAYLSYGLLPDGIKNKLSIWQYLIILFSFFPLIAGIQAGQNHTLTLILFAAIVVFMLSEKDYLAGVMAGCLIYKPQLVIGLLIIWIVWKKLKALGAFAITAGIWVGAFLAVNGPEPLVSYLTFSKDLFLLPYQPGFPGYLLTTLYGFLTTILPTQSYLFVRLLSTILFAGLLAGLVWIATKFSNKPIADRLPAVALAIMFPILATPYALVHDMLVIILVFVLWTRLSATRTILLSAISVYLGCFLLTFLSALLKIALLPLITIGLTGLIAYDAIKSISTKPERAYP